MRDKMPSNLSPFYADCRQKQQNTFLKRGFSLIELSIVLIILGLLIGAILGGRSLIRTAELQSVLEEFSTHQAAVDAFHDLYSAMPGDMPNATRLWGAADGGDGFGADCHGIASSGKETCNGTGDGFADSAGSGATGGGVNIYGERFRFWQHLANAGLIEGHYTGRTDSATDIWALTAGKNVPKAEIGQAVWTVDALAGTWTGHAHFFDRKYDRHIYDLREGDSYPLNTAESKSIDNKIDDGKAGTGIVFTVKYSSTWAPGCATTDVTGTAEYELSDTSIKCLLFFAGRR